MPTAERRPLAGPDVRAGERAAALTAYEAGTGALRGPRRSVAWTLLALVLAGAFALRLWGIGTGLPYVYNVDEAAHFVPKAVAMSSGGGLDPRYFVNPPALTYLLHGLFSLWYGGTKGVVGEFVNHRAHVFLLARIAVATLGALAVWLLYLLGVRLFDDRRIGLLAAALEGVAFLPVFYGHFALNDAATLAPLTLSLLGSALVLRRGRARDYALAGAALGLACATKYTAGIVLLPLLAAAAMRPRDRRNLGLLCLAGASALGAFLLANPYALLDFHRFQADLVHQSSLASDTQGKLGAPHESGLLYYAWSLTWALGWVPVLAALGGALSIWRRDARAAWLLVPPLLVFALFMGVQGRYFGRWLLPVFPLLCLLAAAFTVNAVHRPASGGARLRRMPLMALATVALLAQGAIYSVHVDLVLSRADTRASARVWMLAHVPRGARIVLEPIVRDEWLREGGPGPLQTHLARWEKYPELGPLVSRTGAIPAEGARATKIEEYELTLAPALIARYERQGYCWVISGSTQFGRASSDPERARWALAYYRALRSDASVVYRVSPYRGRDASVPFSFDWSFDYYPLAYARPGPQVFVYRLHGGRCAK